MSQEFCLLPRLDPTPISAYHSFVIEELEPHSLYAESLGFTLQLGKEDFVYREGNQKVTIPVEMLMSGECLWVIARSTINKWDSLQTDPISDSDRDRILARIVHYAELTNKRVRVIGITEQA